MFFDYHVFNCFWFEELISFLQIHKKSLILHKNRFFFQILPNFKQFDDTYEISDIEQEF